MGPESSATAAFVGTLAIRGELQRFYHKQRIDDRFFSQTPRLCKVIVMRCCPKQVEPATSCNRSVKANVRECTAHVYSGLVDSQLLLCLRIVVERNSRGSSKRQQPVRVIGANAQRARPNASLVVPQVFETLPNVRQSTSYRVLGRTLLLTSLALRRASTIVGLCVLSLAVRRTVDLNERHGRQLSWCGEWCLWSQGQGYFDPFTCRGQTLSGSC